MYSYIFYSVIVICLTIIFCFSLKFYLNYKTNNKIERLTDLAAITNAVINSQREVIAKKNSEITALKTDLIKAKRSKEVNNKDNN